MWFRCVPVLSSLKEEEAVVQSAQGKGLDFVIDTGDQTDPCIADHSERHHPWPPPSAALSDVVVRHLLAYDGQASVSG